VALDDDYKPMSTPSQFTSKTDDKELYFDPTITDLGMIKTKAFVKCTNKEGTVWTSATKEFFVAPKCVGNMKNPTTQATINGGADIPWGMQEGSTAGVYNFLKSDFDKNMGYEITDGTNCPVIVKDCRMMTEIKAGNPILYQSNPNTVSYDFSSTNANTGVP